MRFRVIEAIPDHLPTVRTKFPNEGAAASITLKGTQTPARPKAAKGAPPGDSPLESRGRRDSGGDLEAHSGAQNLQSKFWGSSSAQHEKKRRSRPISRVLSWTVIPLGAASPLRSSNLPGDTAGRGIASLFGLAPGGVCRAGPLPDSRCALTAPFHPCPHPATPLPAPESTWPASPATVLRRCLAKG